MVSVRENWTDVVAEILSLDDDSELQDHTRVTVRLERVEPVAGHLSLDQEQLGVEVVLLVARDSLEELDAGVGDRLAARVRRGRRPDRLFTDERSLAKQ